MIRWRRLIGCCVKRMSVIVVLDKHVELHVVVVIQDRVVVQEVVEVLVDRHVEELDRQRLREDIGPGLAVRHLGEELGVDQDRFLLAGKSKSVLADMIYPLPDILN